MGFNQELPVAIYIYTHIDSHIPTTSHHIPLYSIVSAMKKIGSQPRLDLSELYCLVMNGIPIIDYDHSQKITQKSWVVQALNQPTGLK